MAGGRERRQGDGRPRRLDLFGAADRRGPVSIAASCEARRRSGRRRYGGTPTDVSIVQAIAAIRERGLAVTLYPFLAMDIAWQRSA